MAPLFYSWSDSDQRALENWELNLAISNGQGDFDNQVWTWKSLVDKLQKGLRVAGRFDVNEQKAYSDSGSDSPFNCRAWYPGPMKMTEEGWALRGQSLLVLDFNCSRPEELYSFLKDKCTFDAIAWCLYPVVDLGTGKVVSRLISPFAETVSPEVSMDAHRFLSADLKDYAEDETHVPLTGAFETSQQLDWPQVQSNQGGYFYQNSGPVIFADMFAGSEPDDEVGGKLVEQRDESSDQIDDILGLD